MASEREVAAMRRALVLAASPGVPRGPNPRVGCVVLTAEGEVAGEGYHRGAGTPHAEVGALRAAGERARGGTAVVTLEPCAHTGRTGPCTEALLAANIVRVVYAQTDPNPLAAGGAGVLRAAGIDVEGGLLATEAQALNEEWSHAVGAGRPYVTWKLATTLDGRSAAADGSSRWITGEAARRDVHRLRAASDAVLVGTGTFTADAPRLTVRDAAGRDAERQPIRAVMGRRPLTGTDGWTVLRTADPHEALATLFRLDVQSVLLEGGPTLAAAFLRERLVDRVVAYVAPVLLGAGPAAVADLGLSSIDEALRLECCEWTPVGDDVRLTGRPAYRTKEK